LFGHGASLAGAKLQNAVFLYAKGGNRCKLLINKPVKKEEEDEKGGCGVIFKDIIMQS
jgi:hypothetical protein